MLWPLLHYALDRIPADGHDWEVYRSVNERFADVTAKHYQPGDIVWVHDYQLMLVPKLLRERVPNAIIGYFHHIPFPSSDVFRALPWRDAILEGLLGADLVGFHSFEYARHFTDPVLSVLGIEPRGDAIGHDAREVRVGRSSSATRCRSFRSSTRR